MNIDQKFGNRIKQVEFDAHSPIPLYHQVYSFLNKLIQDDVLATGSTFPPEIDLAKTLKVSRQTVRQAMALLVSEGKIERFSGKGTFVSKNDTRNQFFLDKSFSQQMTELGKQNHAKVLELLPGIVDNDCSKFLQSKLGAPCLKLTRLRFGDEEPIGLQTAIIITEKCPDLDKHDFSTASLFQLLTDKYKLEISEIFHTVNANIAQDAQAKLLGVKPGSPLLYEEAVTYLSTGEVIETSKSYFRADRYEYSVRFKYKSKKSIWQGI